MDNVVVEFYASAIVQAIGRSDIDESVPKTIQNSG